MARTANSVDVARRANVSRTTVSLVVNGVKDARISGETRERVWQAARELNYMPNAAGRSLVRGRTETIALVLRDVALLDVDLYLQPLLFGILTKAQEAGYGLRVESDAGEGAASIGSLLDSGHIDGMIVENLDLADENLRQMIEAGRPIVVLGSQGAENEYAVHIDDLGAARIATQHLIDLGRRRIAHVAYAKPGIHAVDARLEGYRQALGKASVPYDDQLVAYGRFSSSSGYEVTIGLMTGTAAPPDAIFAGSDAIAIGVMAAAHDLGLSIPKDLSIVGFDDIGLAASIRPSLTTIRGQPFLSGTIATSMLLDLIGGKKPSKKVVMIDAQLVQRGTTIEGYDRIMPL